MSPILFVTVVNYVLKKLNDKFSEYGIPFNGLSLLFTAYLDDICIITNTYDQLIEVYTELKELFEVFGLQINISKTKIMTNEQNILSHIEIVESFKYLGEMIYHDEYKSLNMPYKIIFKQIFHKMYRIDKLRVSEDIKNKLYQEYTITWIRKKLMVYYDLPIDKKENIYKIVNYFLTKWKNMLPENLNIFNNTLNIVRNSNDPYIKSMLKDQYFNDNFYDTMKKFNTTTKSYIKYSYN